MINDCLTSASFFGYATYSSFLEDLTVLFTVYERVLMDSSLCFGDSDIVFWEGYFFIETYSLFGGDCFSTSYSYFDVFNCGV